MLDLKKLKEKRIAKGLTQSDMAHKMGWKDRAAYAKRENGFVNIGADELQQMAKILGVGKNKLGIFFNLDVPENERDKEDK